MVEFKSIMVELMMIVEAVIPLGEGIDTELEEPLARIGRFGKIRGRFPPPPDPDPIV